MVLLLGKEMRPRCDTGWMGSEVVFCSSKVDLKVQEYSNNVWESGIPPKQGDTCPQGTEDFRVILAVSS